MSWNGHNNRSAGNFSPTSRSDKEFVVGRGFSWWLKERDRKDHDESKATKSGYLGRSLGNRFFQVETALGCGIWFTANVPTISPNNT